MDPFEDRLRTRIETLEAAAPVKRPARVEETRMSRLPALRWGALAGVAAAAVIAVAFFAWPAATTASTRTYALDQEVTVTARTNAVWAGTVDQAAAEAAIRAVLVAKLGPGADVHVTAAWQVAGTLEVKGHDWSMSWSGPTAEPLDVWVIEFAGTAGEGWPVTVSGVVDARTGRLLGGGISQQIPASSLGQDPNKPLPGEPAGSTTPAPEASK